MIYFTADLHLGHAKIIQHCNRPFKHVKEMDDTLIANWNKIVTDNDTIYILGDLTCNLSKGKTMGYLKRLPGRKILILGNHDNHIRKEYDDEKNKEVWYYFEKVTHYEEIMFDKKVICMFHYGIEHWHWRNRGAIHLCGHSHGNSTPTTNRIDVGVDCWDYRPVSIYQVLEKLEKI